jgi:hypothetical protein
MHEASKVLKKKAPPSEGLNLKKAQANYSPGEALEKLTTAVNEWNAGTGRALDSNGEKRGLVKFSNLFGIPFDTFRKYVHPDPEKRREVGRSSGRPSLLTKGNQGFILDALACLDRAKDGLDLSGAIDLVQDISSHLSRTQARQTFSRTIRPNHPNILKPKTMTAQATTAKRSAITVPQQFRWLRTYYGCLDDLRRRNLGVCNLTGKTFGELIRHFIFGGDETCMQACANGVVKVVGSAGRKKDEKKTNDSRVSITMYRTGNIADVTGPTIFLLEEKRKHEGFTDKFLVDHGAAIGSTCIMTATAFMTEEAWVQATPSVIKGFLSSDPVVQANPQWCILELFDGHGPLTMSLPAMQLCYDSKILLLKEEGDSSHVNQAYGKFVAPANKNAKNESLAMLRGCTLVNKGVVDQWGLIHVGLFAIQALKARAWTNSFKACNMDPLTSICFPQWCKKIEHFIQASQSFKTEGPLNTYALLPSFWHGMTLEEAEEEDRQYHR